MSVCIHEGNFAVRKVDQRQTVLKNIVKKSIHSSLCSESK